MHSAPSGPHRILTPQNACAGVLVLIGFLRPLGQNLGIYPLAIVGQASMASPHPAVFLRGTGGRAAIRVETASGREVVVDANPGLIERIRGPFWRRKLYLEALLRRPPKSRGKLDSVLGFGLCGPGDLAASFGIEEPIRRLRVSVWEVAEPRKTRYEFSFECEP